MEVINLIFSENNPAGIKAVLQRLELTSDNVRLPLIKASEKLQKEIANFVKNLE
jgi:4-hydroxy-tetrahydrodipicolinate synthase